MLSTASQAYAHQCGVCGTLVESDSALQKHYRDSYIYDDALGGRYNHHFCLTCDIGFEDEDTLAEHIDYIHITSISHGTVTMTSTHDRSIGPAMKQTSQSSPTSRGIGVLLGEHTAQWYCPLCNTGFKKRRQLMRHNLFTPRHPCCTICKIGLDNFDRSEEHQAEIHPSLRLTWSRANTPVSTSSGTEGSPEFSKGVACDSDACPPFRCLVCDDSYDSLEALSTHMTTNGHGRFDSPEALRNDRDALQVGTTPSASRDTLLGKRSRCRRQVNADSLPGSPSTMSRAANTALDNLDVLLVAAPQAGANTLVPASGSATAIASGASAFQPLVSVGSTSVPLEAGPQHEATVPPIKTVSTRTSLSIYARPYAPHTCSSGTAQREPSIISRKPDIEHCTRCNRWYSTKQLLLLHFYESGRHPRCVECRLGFAGHEEYDQHWATVHSPIEPVHAATVHLNSGVNAAEDSSGNSVHVTSRDVDDLAREVSGLSINVPSAVSNGVKAQTEESDDSENQHPQPRLREFGSVLSNIEAQEFHAKERLDILASTSPFEPSFYGVEMDASTSNVFGDPPAFPPSRTSPSKPHIQGYTPSADGTGRALPRYHKGTSISALCATGSPLPIRVFDGITGLEAPVHRARSPSTATIPNDHIDWNAERRSRPTSNGPSWHCRICGKDPCDGPTATRCGHVFCYRCIIKEIAETLECPVCQTPCLLRLHVI